MTPALKQLSSRLGYHFASTELLVQALTHRSVRGENNERLEFLGDAVLSVVIAQWLYESFPEASEGELTRWRASLVKGSTLAKVARKLELGECLVLGGGELKSGGHRRDSILADAVEALLGAVFLEAGLEGSRERVHDWFAELLEAITLGSDEKDAKTRLQEYLQSRGKPLPVYKVMQVAGDQHDQIFTVSCSIRDLDGPVTAQAPSRKKAEKRAAEQALSQLLGH